MTQPPQPPSGQPPSGQPPSGQPPTFQPSQQHPPEQLSQQPIQPIPPAKKSGGGGRTVIVGVIAAVAGMTVGGIGGSLTAGSGSNTAGPGATTTVTATATATKTVIEAPTDEPTDQPTDEPTAEPTDTDPGVLKFGQTITWEDRLEASITSAKRRTISRYAAGGKAGEPMAVITIKIKNGTKKAFNADDVSVNVTYGSGGTQADQVYDEGLDNFEGTIAKGRSRSALYGFAVSSKGLKDLVVEIAPSYDYTPALFSGSAK
jgi:hypothetical protein